jgi:TM2 domain-containing membrane protein YozV
MFKIIGGDRRPYGPVSIEQLRQWIAEGRANAQTLAQAEGAVDWKPLGTLPEFAGGFPPPATPPMLVQDDLRKSKLVAGLLGVLIGYLGIHRFYLGYVGIGVAQIVVTFCTCGLGGLWGFIEGIPILVGSAITTDAEGCPLKEQ